MGTAEEQSEPSDGLLPAAGGRAERAGGGRPSGPDGAEGQLEIRSKQREVRAKAEVEGSSPTAVAALLLLTRF
jgi:hypothetical protein